MKRTFLSTLTIAGFTLFLASCGGGEAVELKLNVAKGDSYACVVNMDQTVTTSAMGMNMKIDQDMEINQTLSVEEVAANGNVTFKNVMERFYMKQSMPMMGKPIVFDTDKPEEAGAMGAMMGQYFSKMKGLTYVMEMDAHGKMLSSNLDEVYAQLGLDSLQQQGGSNNSNNVDQYMSQLPEKAIQVGDSYVIESDKMGLGGYSSKNTYTVKEITSDLVKLDVKTEFVKGEKPASGEVYMDLKGEQTGLVEIDRKTGMTLKSEIKQNLEMVVSSAGMEMPMKTSGTITFTSVKK